MLDYMRGVLVPEACRILLEKYEAYGRGENIGVETKSDSTPASEADREAERFLRKLIREKFPDHGVWGEEFGAENVSREWVWVLDPLDGTKEFLSGKPGKFGTLIGLLHNGKAVMGAVGDPVNGDVWLSDGLRILERDKKLGEAVVSCTCPEVMFADYMNEINLIEEKAGEFIREMNCIGFADIITGKIDAVVESGLKIHDIAALIPVLANAGGVVIDFEGNDYSDMDLDPCSAQSKKFGVIAAAGESLAQEILSVFKNGDVV